MAAPRRPVSQKPLAERRMSSVLLLKALASTNM